MDSIIKEQIDNLITDLKLKGEQIDDPVSKLMLTALVYQTRQIQDEIDRIPDKVADRLCSYFIPKDKADAIPALCLIQPVLKPRKDMYPHKLAQGTFFSYKLDSRQALTYYPLFSNLIIPYSRLHILTRHILKSGDKTTGISFGPKGQVWLGIETGCDIESLCNLSFFIKGTGGLLPERISAAEGSVGLTYTAASKMESVPMAEPFDAQQSQHRFFEALSCWKYTLSGTEDGRLIYITDTLTNRDTFKCRAYPKKFLQALESNDLDSFESNTLWLLFDFGKDYDVPDNIEIIPNVMPAVNVNINSVTLTQSAPIANLTKNDGTYFFSLIQTSSAAGRQGFNPLEKEIIIRDFDASRYDSDDLLRNIRELYHRFINDYYAFMDYYELKDGEQIRTLRESINKICRRTLSEHTKAEKFDHGIYVMRNVNSPDQSSVIRISYLTTSGKDGNLPKAGETMENRKDAAIDKDVRIIVSGKGGENKADAGQRYELLRYYALTSDRLYTKMDIDAFIRMQIVKEFGKDESKRIRHNITVQGTGGDRMLRRGLYIDISFKDEKNYRKAVASSLEKKLQQQISDRSCISMPIKVSLLQIED